MRQTLGSPGDDDVGVALADLIRSLRNGGVGRGARPIDGRCRHGRRKLRQQTDFSREVGGQRAGDHLAEVHLIDHLTVQIHPVNQFDGSTPGQIDRRYVLE